jgi:hypothetical protein
VQSRLPLDGDIARGLGRCASGRCDIRSPERLAARACALIVTLLAIAAVLLVSTGLFWARSAGPSRLAQPDTFWYVRQAVLFDGKGVAAANAAGNDVICQARNEAAVAVGRPPACHHYITRLPDPRYIRIFTTRPGFALLAAPLITLFGLWNGMIAATLICCLLVALLMFAAVRQLGGSMLAAMAAVILIFVLPSGYWMTRMLPEGAILAGYLATGIGAIRIWRGQWRSGFAITAAALAWLFAMKPANGLVVALALLAPPAVLALVRVRVRARGGSGYAAIPVVSWRVIGRVAVPGLAGTLGWLVVSHAAHLPGLTYTIQDLASEHFQGRLVADPIGWLLWRDAGFWPGWLFRQALNPWAACLVAAGTGLLAWRCRVQATPWLIAGFTGLVVLAAHPLYSEADRLVLPVWLPTAMGLALFPWSRLRRFRVPEPVHQETSAGDPVAAPAGGGELAATRPALDDPLK